MLPKNKTISTHTMHFKWHHRNLSKTDHESLETNHEWRHAWSFSIFNTKNVQKYQNFYLTTQIEHDQSSYFCGGLKDFCWGPAPVGPTLVTGPHQAKSSSLSDHAQRMLGGQQWRAGVVAPQSADVWLTSDVACLQHRWPVSRTTREI